MKYPDSSLVPPQASRIGTWLMANFAAATATDGSRALPSGLARSPDRDQMATIPPPFSRASLCRQLPGATLFHEVITDCRIPAAFFA
jgi:hypothetical protein